MTFGFKQGAVYVTDAATSRTNLGITNVATQSVTQHDILVGGSANAITSVAPSATSGVPVISQGASADPAFGTAVVAGGGTGAASFNINGPVISNTTTTGALAAVALASQKFLVGTSGAPIAKALSIVRQVFTSDGTYTPTSGMVYCDIICVGGGGGGGGTASAAVSIWSAGGGGGGGGTSYITSSAATIGASQTVTIGAAGAAGSSGNNAGGNGGDTSVGTICIGKGGTGGPGSAGTAGAGITGGAGGVAGTGSFSVPGQQGGNSYCGGAYPVQGEGGASLYGFGGRSATTSGTTAAGNAGQNYGGAGSGGISFSGTGATAGGAGVKGLVVVTEYVIA